MRPKVRDGWRRVLAHDGLLSWGNRWAVCGQSAGQPGQDESGPGVVGIGGWASAGGTDTCSTNACDPDTGSDPRNTTEASAPAVTLTSTTAARIAAPASTTAFPAFPAAPARGDGNALRPLFGTDDARRHRVEVECIANEDPQRDDEAGEPDRAAGNHFGSGLGREPDLLLGTEKNDVGQRRFDGIPNPATPLMSAVVSRPSKELKSSEPARIQSRSGAPGGKYCRYGRASLTARTTDGRASSRCRYDSTRG